MKIITASKYYYQRAGLESYLFKISDTLKSKGHEVIPFSTTYKENVKTEFDKYFAEYIEIGGDESLGLANKVKALSRIFYNAHARKNISRLINDTKPDVLWGFGIHRHLSPSIFMEAKENGIPVVHRLSDYALICADSRLTKGDNSNCDELLCPLKGYHNAVINKCVRQSSPVESSKAPSIAASAIGAAELFLHNRFKFYTENVNRFIAPSQFLKNTMIKAGMPEQKIVHIPIYIDHTKYIPEYSTLPYAVYVGRLSREKGLPMLLKAMAKQKHNKLIIVGDGPQKQELLEIKRELNLINVEFVGKKHGDTLKTIVRNSRLVIVPSTWYENSPNVILEAFALGKAVLAAKIGGIPELITEGSDGLLFRHDNEQELAEKISYLMDRPILCEEMGKAGRYKTERFYNPESHYEKVMETLSQITK